MYNCLVRGYILRPEQHPCVAYQRAEFEDGNFTFQPEFHVDLLFPDKSIIEEDDPLA